jgi:hypothetical protein
MAESDAELLLDPAVQADPFGYYEQLRAEQPVLRMPGTGFYVLTRYEDLRTILRDPETFSNTLDLEELSGERAKTLGALFHERLAEKGWPHVPTLHQSDPPEHTRYRRLLNKVFSPGRVRQMIPDVQRTCDHLIDAFEGRGRCEFVQEFAFPLPGIVISEQLGLAADQIATFRRWADAMLAPAQGLLTPACSSTRSNPCRSSSDRHVRDVPHRHPDMPQHGRELGRLVPGQRRDAEVRPVEGRGGVAGHAPAGVGDGGQDDAPVLRRGVPLDQPALLQPADRVGHRGRVDHQALAHPAHRHGPAPGEGQQPERLVRGEGQPVGLQGGLDPGQQQLLDPHDRGHGGHVVGVLRPPRAPLAVRLGNGVERVGIGHSPTVRLDTTRQVL